MKNITSISGLRELFRTMPTKQHEKGQVLIHRSDRLHHFFVISSGYVKVYTIDESGEEVIYLILGPGDLFPLLKNPDQAEAISLYYYETITPASVGIVDRKKLIDHIKGDRDASWALLRYISEFSSTLTSRLSQLEGKRAEQKLENTFPYLVEVCGEKLGARAHRLKVKFTHQEIANLIGITRETVSREIKKMENAGQVEHDEDGYLIIKSVE